MNPQAMLAEALRAMAMNRMRSGLTMLGMIIGVAAVVLMMAVGQGAQESVKRSIDSMGSNLFIVLSGASTSGGIRFGTGTAPTLTLSDARDGHTGQHRRCGTSGERQPAADLRQRQLEHHRHGGDAGLLHGARLAIG